MTETVSKLAAMVARVLIVIAGIATILMVLHTLAEVCARYFFRSPIPGTLEIASYYYLVPLSFLPLATVELRGEHVTVEAFTHFLPPRWIKVLDSLVRVLCIACLLLFTWRTGVEAFNKTLKHEFYSATYFNLPIWPIRWVLPLSFAAFALAMLASLLKGLSSGAAPGDHEIQDSGI